MSSNESGLPPYYDEFCVCRTESEARAMCSPGWRLLTVGVLTEGPEAGTTTFVFGRVGDGAQVERDLIATFLVNEGHEIMADQIRRMTHHA